MIADGIQDYCHLNGVEATPVLKLSLCLLTCIQYNDLILSIVVAVAIFVGLTSSNELSPTKRCAGNFTKCNAWFAKRPGI